MNKPKLNQPDVETTTTTVHIGSKVKEIMNIPMNVPNCEIKDVFVPMLTVKNMPDIIKYNGKFYIQIDPPEPTLEEVKKEWEDDGYEWKEFKESKEIHLTKRIDIIKEETIKISLETKCYIKFERCIVGYVPSKLSFQEHIRLTKTFRAKGWEV